MSTEECWGRDSSFKGEWAQETCVIEQGDKEECAKEKRVKEEIRVLRENVFRKRAL